MERVLYAVKMAKTILIIHTSLNYPLKCFFWMFACRSREGFHTHTENPARPSRVFLLLSFSLGGKRTREAEE